MLAEKVMEKAKPNRSLFNKVNVFLIKLPHLKAEDLLEMLTNVMFKAILIFGVPYFIYVFIKFLSIY
ncbi:hypothetical protein EV207_10288 [Scopulibacillus darangshiensis]|uniref:Uncharacterized protein n=1 Tax=Scopulibacillus darangshiensis TaxID=442528 RepID=A0A4R2PB30_9BACL|nr:hypothetical protein [Scopulibacillus darangshiensis]TCP31598.1 hypothetical protein EV207_10288 [Scopulibacillus darangshiensis]